MELVLLTALGVGGATVIGALLGFLLKRDSHRFHDVIIAFAAGVMLAAAVFGLVMESLHLGGKFDNELLLLSPVAVKTKYQRQHISKDLIEYGFIKAKKLGYKAVIVEGNPQNYKNRGFVTSHSFGINAHPSVGLPHPDCLMVKELYEGSLTGISGLVEYSMYESLR